MSIAAGVACGTSAVVRRARISITAAVCSAKTSNTGAWIDIGNVPAPWEMNYFWRRYTHVFQPQSLIIASVN